ncbi:MULTISPECIES: hypothetical protein [unclassified Microcoleus]|uniref:hypothetical protein n=1 Tax=unclassified Microcoleus TaxID=2642155 RepID=UPI00187DF6A0
MKIQLCSAKSTDRQNLTYIVVFLNIAGLGMMIVDRLTLSKLNFLRYRNPIGCANQTFLAPYDAESNFLSTRLHQPAVARWGFVPQPNLQSAGPKSRKVLQARPIPLKYRVALALLNLVYQLKSLV